jgi:hypothetical protein
MVRTQSALVRRAPAPRHPKKVATSDVASVKQHFAPKPGPGWLCEAERRDAKTREWGG